MNRRIRCFAAAVTVATMAVACGSNHGDGSQTDSAQSTHTVDVSWIASVSPNVTGYNLYRGTTSGGPYPTLITSVPVMATTTYTDTNVPSCTTVYYAATAIDAADQESSLSAEIQAVIPCP